MLTYEQIDEIVAAYNSGLTLDQVSCQLGHGLSSVNKYLRERDVDRRQGGPRNQVQELMLHLDIRERYDAGVSAAVIARDILVSRPTIIRVLRAQGATIKDRSECQVKYSCDHRFFQTIDTEEKAYWLGFFTADGSVRPPNGIALCIALKDGDHVHQFAKALCASYPIEDRLKRKWPMTEIAFRSTQMTADLSHYGIVPNKGQTVPWPILGNEFVRHYLRGAIDGDGSFYVSRKQVGMMLASNLDYLTDCQNLLMQIFGFKRTKISKAGKKVGIRCMKYGGNRQLLPFFNYLYADATIYLPRKRDIVLRHYQSLPKYRDQLRFG